MVQNVTFIKKCLQTTIELEGCLMLCAARTSSGYATAVQRDRLPAVCVTF